MADQVEKGDKGKPSPYKRIHNMFDGDPEDSSNAGLDNVVKTFESPAFALGPYSSPARTADYTVTTAAASMLPGQTNGGLLQFW